MPIIVIDGKISKKLRKKLKRDEERMRKLEKLIKPEKSDTKKDFIKLLAKEKRLLKLQKRRPFDIEVHIDLEKLYREQKRWAETEIQQEIIESLGRIKRLLKYNLKAFKEYKKHKIIK